MKNILPIFLLFSSLINSQIYSNGSLSTGTTSTGGTIAPSGYSWSELQTSNTTLGFSGYYNNAATSSFRLSDDFVVPTNESWAITSIEVFGYQTGSTVFPFDALRLQLINGASPSAGTVVFGNLTSNVLNSNSDSFIYRIASTAAGTTRRIWKLKANVVTNLLPGTYWVDFQAHATNDSSAFFPPVTVVGASAPSGANAQQYNGSWATAIDNGSVIQQAIPFIVTYTVTLLGVTETRQFDNRLIVYPNPVSNTFKLSIPEESLLSTTKIVLFDNTGNAIKNFKISDSYDISNLPKGNYILKLYDGKNIKVTKVIKN